MKRTLALSAMLFTASLGIAAPKSYRLPSVDLKQPIIWGSEAEGAGVVLAFGGQDQVGEEGRAPTRLKVDGKWIDLREELRKANPTQKTHDAMAKLVRDFDRAIVANRSDFFGGTMTDFDGRTWVQKFAVHTKSPEFEALDKSFPPTPASYQELTRIQRRIEQFVQRIDAEPSGRALSPIVFDPKSKLFVFVGGDHLDYLTNDTWVFDPAKRRWELRLPMTAPAPRANHTLKANDDGTITLSGGYTYTSTVDYLGGHYRDLDDGDWTYDVASNTWKGANAGVASDTRVYRTGPYDPAFFTDCETPDRKSQLALLEKLPPNTWTKMNPPRMPQMNRDWGSAIIDNDRRNVILRWAGGHSAHCGTDVLQYHIATNRWELTHPIEFPLGQTYTNTEYPEGFNFNQRPWISGHTYQNYGWDLNEEKMLFLGKHRWYYAYDTKYGDWTGERFEKPKGMIYDSSFYTLTTTATNDGLVCWTAQGKLFRFDEGWKELALVGEKLPGAVVDNSTLTWDQKRNRLLFVVKSYGDKVKFSGQVHEVDLKTLNVKALSPGGMEAASDIPYLCQMRYSDEHDLCLVGGTLSPDKDGLRRTPAFDCAGNRWVSLKIVGDDPSGAKGRNVSLGLMWHRKSGLFWAVDAKSQVFALRLDVAKAEMKALGE